MFTGIVEEAGQVVQTRATADGIRLVVCARRCAQDLKIGDSLAVNGCCLTVVKSARTSKRSERLLHFDLLQETWNRTSFRQLRPGRRVNLERALRADSRLGGHFVTGHIDATGTIIQLTPSGSDHLLQIQAPPEIMRYVLFKGSIAVDGVSLTVAAVRKHSFQVWLIPHTWEITSLSDRQAGDLVNLEADLLGKYVDALLPRSGKGRNDPRRRRSRH